MQTRISVTIIKGFSLLEVLLVLFILGLMLGTTIPFLAKKNSNLKQLTTEFVNLVNCARNRANITSDPYFLRINIPSKYIEVLSEEKLALLFGDEDKEDEITTTKNGASNPKCSLKKDQLSEIISFTFSTIDKNLIVESIEYGNNYSTSGTVQFRFDPSGFSELFTITFTDGDKYLAFQQTSVLGNYNVFAKK